MTMHTRRRNLWVLGILALATAALAFAACTAPGVSMTGPTPSAGAAGRAFPMTVGDESAAFGVLGAKGDICHVNGEGEFRLINVSQNALSAHREHGDAAPGELVPGDPSMRFGGDCSLRPVDHPPTTPPPGL